MTSCDARARAHSRAPLHGGWWRGDNVIVRAMRARRAVPSRHAVSAAVRRVRRLDWGEASGL